MFGFGKKSKSSKSDKDDRHTEQKDNEASWSFLGSAKEQSDREAKRGGR